MEPLTCKVYKFLTRAAHEAATSGDVQHMLLLDEIVEMHVAGCAKCLRELPKLEDTRRLAVYSN
jgi:hypothetical protein